MKVIALLSTAAVALAFDNQPDARPRTVPGAYIYEFEDGYNANDFIGVLGAEGTVRKTFDTEVFRGISVQHIDMELAKEASVRIASQPHVKNAWPVQIYYPPDVEIHDTGTSAIAYGDNNTANSEHVMIQIDKLHKEGFTGKNVKIAILDTGVYYLHPALGGCFGKGCLISFGGDLTGDNSTSITQSARHLQPEDCVGHGTHVTGIVAAQPNSAGFIGAAPGATIGFYRVFPCNGGGAPTELLIDAITMAAEAGADIITASLGHSQLFSEDAVSDVLDRYVVQKGLIATVAAGNSGLAGAILPSAPASGDKVFAIASFQNSISTKIVYSSDYMVDGASSTHFTFTPDPYIAYYWENVTMPLWTGNFNASKVDYGCHDYPDNTPDLSEFIVLLPNNEGSFSWTRAEKAAAKGARYIAFYEDDGGTFTKYVYKHVQKIQYVPVATALNWINALSAGHNITLHMRSEKNAQAIERPQNTTDGGAVSVFTSWGPTLEMKTKPQFGAPGGRIISTLPREQGSYGVRSGTSMATPLLAGAIALILEARGGRIPHDMLESLLASTARPATFHNGKKFLDYLAPVAQQGGGLISAHDVAFAASYLEPASLSFNESRFFNPNKTFTIRNVGKSTATYNIGHASTKTLYVLGDNHTVSVYPNFPTNFVDEHASLVFNSSKVSVKPGNSVSISITATPPKSIDASRLALWSGYITVNGTDGTKLSLPYQGLTGDFYTVKPLLKDSVFAGNLTTHYFDSIPEGGTFRLPKPGAPDYDDSLPVYVVNLPFATPVMRTDVISLSGSTPSVVGQLFDMPTERYDRAVQQRVFWLGKLANGAYAAKGKYRVASTALRIHGDATKEEDWFRSESVFFNIEYKE